MKYFFTFPQGGFNDICNIIWNCYSYSLKYGRILVIDTRYCISVEDDIRKYLLFSSPIIYNDDIDILYNSVKNKSSYPCSIYYKDVKDSFIWLTGIVPKKLVMKDHDTGETHYSTSRACVFNNNNIHSSLGHPECTAWSLRIDGNFNKDWAVKAGIADYYNL